MSVSKKSATDKRNETWAEFSALDVGVLVHAVHCEHNNEDSLILSPKHLLDYLLLAFALPDVALPYMLKAGRVFVDPQLDIRPSVPEDVSGRVPTVIPEAGEDNDTLGDEPQGHVLR
jgi:hypothetical protein